MMLKTLAAASVAALALTATSASATIVIVSGNIPGNPDENVLLNTGASAATIFGTTNQTGASVTFNGMETLTAPSNGQARVEAFDGAYSYLNFYLTDPTGSFTRAEFNINAASTGTVHITATDTTGSVFSKDLPLSGNGENFFNLTTLDGQRIKAITFSTDVAIDDTRQIRLGGVGLAGAVPEPATWGMMILGFGMVGAGLRIRRKPLTRAQA